MDIETLKAIRLRMGAERGNAYSQKEFAEEVLGLSVMTYNKLERFPEKKYPQYEPHDTTKSKIAYALQRPVESIKWR